MIERPFLSKKQGLGFLLGKKKHTCCKLTIGSMTKGKVVGMKVEVRFNLQSFHVLTDARNVSMTLQTHLELVFKLLSNNVT
jgi:hypothetical protein